MSSIPLFHLSPEGRAAIEAESARIKRELAARRAERESRLQALPMHENRDRLPLPFGSSGGTAPAREAPR
jgi:hypothetical protein